MSKMLEIESVTNGWIVRPYSSVVRDYGCCNTVRPHWVFISIEDLQKQLPAMLEWEEEPPTRKE